MSMKLQHQKYYTTSYKIYINNNKLQNIQQYIILDTNKITNLQNNFLNIHHHISKQESKYYMYTMLQNES